MEHNLMQASCRVALAAYLHDLGKFAERAAIPEGEQKDSLGNTLRDVHKQEYCPQFNGRYSHVHAAYTAIAFDVLEASLPDVIKGDCHPFASWKNAENLRGGDSLINAAARHHKPETFLQWVIATADRMASGFERSEFEAYNRAEEVPEGKRSYLQTRQYTLFESIRLSQRPQTHDHRYPLAPLSPDAMFPGPASTLEPANDDAARKQYRQLWDAFLDNLRKDGGQDAIPPAHKSNLPLWLDHFDSLWLAFTQAIPSATAAKVDGRFIAIPADVSLYDHSRTTAALAVALWRYHEAAGRTDATAAHDLHAGSDAEEQKFLLIQGDMFGIQDFIFASGGNTQKHAAKLLRGRSFYVSLLTECAALRVLDALNLPPTSQVTNAAGKFMIVAPNTEDTRKMLERVKVELDGWFLEQAQGRAGLGLASVGACQADFQQGGKGNSRFEALIKRLFAALERAKLQRFDLCSPSAPAEFETFLDGFDSVLGQCSLDGKSPARETRHGINVGALAWDQIEIGECLANSRFSRLLICQERLENAGGLRQLLTPVFGLHIAFTSGEDQSGKFGDAARKGTLLRAWDFSLPGSADQALWNGYARRNINGYAPVFTSHDLMYPEKYRSQEGVDELRQPGVLKDLGAIACEDRVMMKTNENEVWQGLAALHAVKGDVDNLGSIFQKGMERPSFARMAALSRQMNNFFTIYLPWLCSKKFPNTYTVFAGGDDFFLIGPWKSQITLVQQLRTDFSRYVAGNADLHFSAGFYLGKAGLPIRHFGEKADAALAVAKAYTGPRSARPIQKAQVQDGVAAKNAVHCFGRTVGFADFAVLVRESQSIAELKADNAGVSTGFVYGLLRLSEMAGEEGFRPESALWRSWLHYRVVRLIGDRMQKGPLEKPEDFVLRKRERCSEIISKLAELLGKYQQDYHIPLFHYLYQFRD